MATEEMRRLILLLENQQDDDDDEDEDGDPMMDPRNIDRMRRWRSGIERIWREREAPGYRGEPGNDVSSKIYHEFERPGMRDEYGDPIYIEVEIEVSAKYYRGSPGTYDYPAEPDELDNITMERVRIPDNAEGGPLTPLDKVAIEDWFDSREGQEAATDAIFDAISDY